MPVAKVVTVGRACLASKPSSGFLLKRAKVFEVLGVVDDSGASTDAVLSPESSLAGGSLSFAGVDAMVNDRWVDACVGGCGSMPPIDPTAVKSTEMGYCAP